MRFAALCYDVIRSDAMVPIVVLIGKKFFSSSYILYFYNIWRPSTFLCTYGKKLYVGIGMLIKMRTIGLDIQSALLKRVVFCGKS